VEAVLVVIVALLTVGSVLVSGALTADAVEPEFELGLELAGGVKRLVPGTARSRWAKKSPTIL